MLCSTILCAALCAAPQDPAWVVLPLPDLCREPRAPAPASARPDGSHLLLDARRDAPHPPASPLSPLPVATLQELIEEAAGMSEGALEVRRPGPPLLVRGSEAQVAAARGLAVDLGRAAHHREVELEVWLAPVLARSHAAAPPREGADHHLATVPSGGSALLGARSVRTFVGGYDIEVASGSGVADPIPGAVLYGRSVHLTAWRVDGGRGVLLAGVLDLADPPVVERLDLDAPDVGELERPRVSVCQVVFGGRVESGGRLRVTIEGAPLAQAEWSLWVQARTSVDGPAGPGGRSTWRCADLTLLETQVTEPPMPSPGAGLEAFMPSDDAVSIARATPAASIWGAVETGLRSGAPGAPRPLLAFAPGLLVAREDAAAVWSETGALTDALVADRTRTRELTIAAGGLRVTLPVAAGLPARVLVGEESTRLVDYDAEIAAETWMGTPRLVRAIDGDCVQAHLEGEVLVARWWRARSAEGGAQSVDTTHGLLASHTRTLAQGELRARTGGPEARSSSASDALSLLVSTP